MHFIFTVSVVYSQDQVSSLDWRLQLHLLHPFSLGFLGYLSWHLGPPNLLCVSLYMCFPFYTPRFQTLGKQYAFLVYSLYSIPHPQSALNTFLWSHAIPEREIQSCPNPALKALFIVPTLPMKQKISNCIFYIELRNIQERLMKLEDLEIALPEIKQK